MGQSSIVSKPDSGRVVRRLFASCIMLFVPWIQALLHGQVVYAKAREDGSLLLEGNRVEVCYRPKATRSYKARASNVVVAAAASMLPDDACGPRPESATLKKAVPSGLVGRRRSISTQNLSAPKNAIVAYADGACSGNPGPAGLGIVVVDGATRTEISEHLGLATNNIAELTAIERVLDAVPDETRPLFIYTDSAYSIGVLVKGWKAKANLELIERLRKRLAKRPATRLVHVPGHAGIELNERADELAREGVKSRTTRTERMG
jgi:ribonuclease HI